MPLRRAGVVCRGVPVFQDFLVCLQQGYRATLHFKGGDVGADEIANHRESLFFSMISFILRYTPYSSLTGVPPMLLTNAITWSPLPKGSSVSATSIHSPFFGAPRTQLAVIGRIFKYAQGHHFGDFIHGFRFFHAECRGSP